MLSKHISHQARNVSLLSNEARERRKERKQGLEMQLQVFFHTYFLVFAYWYLHSCVQPTAVGGVGISPPWKRLFIRTGRAMELASKPTLAWDCLAAEPRHFYNRLFVTGADLAYKQESCSMNDLHIPPARWVTSKTWPSRGIYPFVKSSYIMITLYDSSLDRTNHMHTSLDYNPTPPAPYHITWAL